MADIAKFIEEIKGMTVLELNELVKAIEEEFGVSAAAAVVSAPVAGAQAPVAEEKTEFNIVLKEIGAQKLAVVKAVKELLGLGLVDAKNTVEKMGVIKENVPKEEADNIVAKLKEAGATAVAE